MKTLNVVKVSIFPDVALELTSSLVHLIGNVVFYILEPLGMTEHLFIDISHQTVDKLVQRML